MDFFTKSSFLLIQFDIFLRRVQVRNLALLREARTIGFNFRLKGYRLANFQLSQNYVLVNFCPRKRLIDCVFLRPARKSFIQLNTFISSKELKTSITCSALIAFKQEEVSIVLHLLGHRASDWPPKDNPIQLPFLTNK